MNIVAELQSVLSELDVTADHVSALGAYFAGLQDNLQQISKICVMYQMEPERPLFAYYKDMREAAQTRMSDQLKEDESDMAFLFSKVYAYSPPKDKQEERFKQHLAEIMADAQYEISALGESIPYIKTSELLHVLNSMKFNFRRQY